MRKWNHIQSLKEVIRHALLKLNSEKLLQQRRSARGYKTAHLLKGTVRERFQEVYRTGAWKVENGQVSLSGTGSEIGATETVRKQLSQVLLQIQCTRLVDIGCGDWTWMQHVELPCEYVGVDIVPEVIESNQRFENSRVTFVQLNAIEHDLPRADVAFCRETLFHLSFADSKKLLDNVKRSANWLIATTDPIWFNSDIKSGDFRLLNLEARPFRLPQPKITIQDESNVPGRYLGVWPTSAL